MNECGMRTQIIGGRFMNTLYSLNSKMQLMTPEQVVAAVNNCEKSLRTAKFTYLEHQAFNTQVEEIKTAWPENYREVVRVKAKELAGTGGITPAVIRQALIAFGDLLAIDRAKASNKPLDSEQRYIAAELALATLFRKAPDCGLTTLVSRRYQENGKSFRVKPAVAPKSLIVNMNEANDPDSADIYLLAAYFEEMKACLLLGYATKEDLQKTKQTENQAYQIPLAELKPMARMYAACKMTEIPSGIAFETVPAYSSLPIQMPKNLQNIMREKTKTEDFDFFGSMGIAAPKPEKKAPQDNTAAL